MSQAARTKSGPIAPCSNGLTKDAVGAAAQEPIEVGLTRGKRQAAQVVAVNRQHVEGAELYLDAMLPGMQRVEISYPVDAQDHGLAVNYELAAAVLQRGPGDPWETYGPVMTAAGDQGNALAVALHAEAVAIEFDFVKPFRRGRYGLADRWDAKFKLHGPKIGNALPECESGNRAMRRLAEVAAAAPAARWHAAR